MNAKPIIPATNGTANDSIEAKVRLTAASSESDSAGFEIKNQTKVAKAAAAAIWAIKIGCATSSERRRFSIICDFHYRNPAAGRFGGGSFLKFD